MRTLLISLLAFLSMGMAAPRPEIPEASPPPASSPGLAQIEPHHAKFRELAQRYGAVIIAQSVSFSFRSFFGFAVGMCQMSSSGRNRVELSESHWARGSETFREMLLFHELGHCLLGRGHKNARHSDGRMESLMSSSMFSQSIYLANRDQYLKELFTVAGGRLARDSQREATFGECKWGH